MSILNSVNGGDVQLRELELTKKLLHEFKA